MAVGCYKGAASHYCNIGQHFQWERTQAWTVFADVKQTRTPDGSNLPVICTHANASPNFRTPIELYINQNGYLAVRIISAFGSSNYLGAYVAINIADGIPRRIIVTYDGSSTFAGIKMYFDGVAQTTTSEGTSLSGTTVTTDDFYIGNQQGVTSTFYIDHLGAFRIYDVAKDATWAASYGDYGSTPPASNVSNTQLCIDWSEGTGTSVADTSGNGFNGTLSSSGLWSTFKFAISVSNRFRQKKTGQNDTTGTTPLAIAFDSNVVAGSLLTVRVNHHSSTANTVAITDSQGNTWAQQGSTIVQGSVRVDIFSTIAGSSAACTVTITQSATCFFQALVTEHTGPWTSATAEATGSSTGASSSVTAGTLTPSGTGRLVIVIAAQNASPLDAGYGDALFGDAILNRASGGIATAFQECFTDVAVSGVFTSYSRAGAASWHGSANWAAIGAIFKPLVVTGIPNRISSYTDAVNRGSRI